jgi:hypothetical protein
VTDTCIPPIPEAEVRMIVVPGQTGPKVHETPSQPVAGHGSMCLLSQIWWET